jgi:hypothetical protein
MEDPLHHDQVVNNRNQDGQDEPDEQHADNTIQQTSNAAMDAQAQVVNANVQETTNAAMEDPLHRDQVVNNVKQTSNTAMDASRPDDTLTDSDQGQNHVAIIVNFPQSLHDHMFWQPPRYHRHVAKLCLHLYSIYYYPANYLFFNY